MGFWNNVLTELDYLGMTNKTLAEKAGFDPSNIGRGVRLNSSPSADMAVRIAKVLNVTVEYLVTKSSAPGSELEVSAPESRRLKTYSEVIKKLDSLPEKTRKSIISLINDADEDFYGLPSRRS